MHDSLQLHPLGIPALDAQVAALVLQLEQVRTIRPHSLYLFGSYLDGSAVEESDLDLFVVTEGELKPDGAARIHALARDLPGPPELDLLPLGTAELLREGQWRLEANSRLVAGSDIRPRLPVITLDSYLRRYTHAPYAYMARVLRRREHLDYPVTYPDPSGDFYGYQHDDGQEQNLKAFVATVCWIASLSAGLTAGARVAAKSAAPAAYRRAVGDEWTGFVETVYRLGKERWGYRVPAGAAERDQLRRLCRAMPDFENRYLRRFRVYLLDQISSPDPETARIAAERLGSWVRYRDPETRAALRRATSTPEPSLQRTALATLQALDR